MLGNKVSSESSLETKKASTPSIPVGNTQDYGFEEFTTERLRKERKHKQIQESML